VAGADRELSHRLKSKARQEVPDLGFFFFSTYLREYT